MTQRNTDPAGKRSNALNALSRPRIDEVFELPNWWSKHNETPNRQRPGQRRCPDDFDAVPGEQQDEFEFT
jgi:hypothetical protein